tara:strand:+ start:148 stop:825 length:678 start_codon:yes stop_codon:yes gene_type:complete
MNKILSNYHEILKQIRFCERNLDGKYCETNLIAVSKQFPKETIQILINKGHKIFGENKVQEAQSKWIDLKRENPEKKIELHLIGPLQSNKANLALDIFDVIQTVDREKIALKLNKYLDEKAYIKKKKFFIQVNIGDEKQKSGIEEKLAQQFFKWCSNDLKLNIMGLMCIPPFGEPPEPFFKRLRKLCDQLNLKHASMGMSNDFESAIEHGATFIRVGTRIFGKRN